MHIVTIEGIPYAWLEQLQEIHAHVLMEQICHSKS